MGHSLRLITYLVPSHPVELYECIAHFLEEQLNVSATLVYESRDPIYLYTEDRPDPFCLKEVDIGFLSPTQYLKMKMSKKIELLPITPVFVHPKNEAQKRGYYVDIIMHTDVEKTVKSFLDLRGSSWGYTGDNSLSSSLTIQKLLRAHGENSSFFGNTISNYSLSSERTRRFCASSCTFLLLKPVFLWQGDVWGCAEKPILVGLRRVLSLDRVYMILLQLLQYLAH